MLKYGLSNVVELQIPMFREFDDQWISSYVSMIFPAYPELFNNWCNLASGTPSKLDLGIKSRWRRKGEDAIVIPGIYAQMLATQAGAQLAGDWTLVLTCRNLQWRFAVLHSAFVVCKQKVVPGGLQVV